jgi:hypothetical protein
MKNRAGTDVVLIVLAGLVAFAATGLAQGKPSKVEIKNDFIVVHPGTKLSRADAQALNDVLKKYDKALYKIQIYKNGKVTKTLGTLNDMYIDQKAVADLAQAKTSGQSERAIQLIAPPGKMAPVNPQTGSAVNPQTGSPTPGVAVNPQTGSPTPGVAVNPQTGSATPGLAVNPQTGSLTPGVAVNPQTGSPTPGVAVNPQTGSPAPVGTQKSASSPVNPQTSSTTNTDQTEFLKRLKPILEKYSQ